MDGGFDSNVSSSEDDAKKSDFSSVESSPEADQRPQSDFLDCVKSLFDIFDSEKKGYVTIDELEKYLNNNDNPLLKTNSTSKKVNLIHTLQQICPANGYVNFKRFSLAIQIALGKRNLDKEKGIGRSLRPRSFLFAVTEVADNESGIKEDKGHGKEKRVSYSPADSVISSDLDDSLEINGKINGIMDAKGIGKGLLFTFESSKCSFYIACFNGCVAEKINDLHEALSASSRNNVTLKDRLKD